MHTWSEANTLADALSRVARHDLLAWRDAEVWTFPRNLKDSLWICGFSWLEGKVHKLS